MSPDTVNSPMEQGPERSEAYLSSPDLVQRTDLLRHLTENSNLIPLVRGVEGSGKSTLIQHLLDLAPENWIPAKIQADVMLQPDALLSSLTEIFDIDESGDQAMNGLIRRFEDLRQEGFLPVIIVDDAHLLPEASIIALLRLHERGPDEGPLAQILIFANPEIENLLKTPQLRVMNLQSLQHLDMPLFTREQTELFLTHFFARNDLSIEELSPAKIDKIHRETKGMPGKIKRLAEDLLKSEEKKQKKQKKQQPVIESSNYFSSRTIIGAGVTFIIVVGLLLFQDSINKLFSGDGQPDVSSAEVAKSSGPAMPLAIPEAEDKAEDQDTTTGTEPPKLDAVAVQEDEDTKAPGDEGLSTVENQEVPPEEAPRSAQEEVQKEPEGEKQENVEQSKVAEEATAPSLDEVPEPSPVQADAMPESEAVEKEISSSKEPETDRSEHQPADETDHKLAKAVEEKPGPEPQPEPEKSAQVNGEKDKIEEAKVKVEVILPEATPEPEPVKEQLTKIIEKKPTEQLAQEKALEELSKPEITKKSEQIVAEPEPDVRVTPGMDASVKIDPAPVEDRSTQVEQKPLPEVKQIVTEQPATKLAQAASPVKKAVSGVSEGLLRERWLLNQKSTSYTIQLVGLQDEKGITGFLRKYSLDGPVSYYRTNRMGKPWYPVLFGSFPDKKSAATARDNLPEKLRKSGAWLRSFASVQKDIKAR